MTGDRRWVIALVVLGAAARLGAALWLGGSFHFVDEAIYVDAARRLLAGEGFGASYNNVPGYPVVLAALAAPWSHHVVLIRAAQALATAFGVVPLIWLGRRLLGPWPARVAGMLYALDPLMVVSGALLYAEAVAAIVLLLALLAARSAVPDRLPWSLVAGLLLGILAQLRPVALVLTPLVAAWIAGCMSYRRLRHALAVIAGCGLALVPWTLRNYRVHGGLVPISSAGTQSAPVDPEDVLERGLTAAMVRRMSRDPVGTVGRIANELAHFWAPYPTRLSTDRAERREAFHEEDPRLPTEVTFSPGLRDRVSALSFGVEMAFALIGAAMAWRRHRAAAVLLLGVCIAYGLGYALIVGKLRYRIPVLPCVFLIAGVAGARLPWLARRQPSVG